MKRKISLTGYLGRKRDYIIDEEGKIINWKPSRIEEWAGGLAALEYIIGSMKITESKLMPNHPADSDIRNAKTPSGKYLWFKYLPFVNPELKKGNHPVIITDYGIKTYPEVITSVEDIE